MCTSRLVGENAIGITVQPPVAALARSLLEKLKALSIVPLPARALRLRSHLAWPVDIRAIEAFLHDAFKAIIGAVLKQHGTVGKVLDIRSTRTFDRPHRRSRSRLRSLNGRWRRSTPS